MTDSEHVGFSVASAQGKSEAARAILTQALAAAPRGSDPLLFFIYNEILRALKAAERDRILALAREYGAVVPADGRAKWASFADLVETLDAKEAADD